LTVPSSAFLNAFADGSAYVFARGQQFFRELASLRFGRMSWFAAVGALGTVLNLAIMSVMLGLEAHYLLAAIVATELTILSNFLMQERLVFRDMRDGRPFWQRILASLGFNNIETLVRIPVLVGLVSVLLVPSLLVQAATLAVAFLIRFAFTSRVIYPIRPTASRPVLVASLHEEQQS
jgi:dolichol-phosphate mannosyltransferase